MGVSSSTLRKKVQKAAHMRAWASTSRKKITQTGPRDLETATSSQVSEMESSKIGYLTDGSLVYGREDDKKKITQLLLSDYNDSNVNIICIVGADGIGKTTMVQLICTEKRVEDAFDKMIFIGMYEKFDEKRLMRAMLESLSGVQCDITESSILEDIVKDELIGKKLLLVLDSAKNENKRFWDNILILLSVAAKGSAVLVTTNRREVANVAGASHCYLLDYLSQNNCWLIFEKLAFCAIDQNAKTELVKIGKCLINKYASNTLCIKMLGGLLSCSVSIEWWNSVLNRLFSSRDETEEALRLCYEYLPSHLKECFIYCSLFPKGYIFSKRYLVHLWLAQGLIEPVIGREIEDMGFHCFEELSSRFFFHRSPLHNAKDDMFIMHELVHNMSESYSRNVCFRSDDCKEIISKDVHHISLVPFEYRSVPLNLIIPQATNLRSILVVSRFMCQQESAFSSIIHLVGLNDLFVKLSSLRVLDLGNSDIEELPYSIKLLSNLGYLGLSNTKIKSIPQEIGSLINLHSLEAKGCFNLVELPKNIQQLHNLRHLCVTKEVGFIYMPVGIGKLTNLRSLSMFYVGIGEIHCGINELKNINDLKGCLHIYGLENVGNEVEARKANLGDKMYLETLSLQWSSMIDIEDQNVAETAQKVLQNLQPSNNLKALNISNYPGNLFPIWIEDPCFSALISIILDNCPNCMNLPFLGGLPSLKYLSLQKMYGVERKEVHDGNFTARNVIKFPSLEVLNLWEMYDLGELFEIRDGDFPHLHTLSVSKCPMMSTIPQLPSLLELSIHCCTQLLKIPKLPLLRSLKLQGLQKIVSLELKDLIMLDKLEISHCSALLCLEGLQLLTSMQELRLIECPKVDLPDAWHPHSCRKYVYTRVDSNREVDTYMEDVFAAQDLQLKKEIDEVIAKEKHEKDHLEHQIQQLNQKIENLEISGGEIIEQKFPLEQLVSYSRGAKKDLEVRLRETINRVGALQAGYAPLEEKFSSDVKERGELVMPSFSEFSFEELKKATYNFSELIGRGGYGSVFKGYLNGSAVAIKVLDNSSSQGIKEFRYEVSALITIRHPHIVTLIGACPEASALVYEFLPNESLEFHLLSNNKSSPVTWQVRTRVIGEICSALTFLHSTNIVHGDLKLSNVLMDANFVSKLIDFGTSRMLHQFVDSISPMHLTASPIGTLAYMDPEYLSSGELTPQSDVFSFGVIILQLLTGKSPRGIVHEVEKALMNGAMQKLIDKSAGDWPLSQAKKLFHIGLDCTQTLRRRRPDLVREVRPIIETLMKGVSLHLPYEYQIKNLPTSQASKAKEFQLMNWDKEMEEVLESERHEKYLIRGQIEQLEEKVQMLQNWREQNLNADQRTSWKLLVSYTERATKDLEVSYKAAQGRLDSLQRAYYQICQPKPVQVVQEAGETSKKKEPILARSHMDLISEFSFQELIEATNNFNDSLKVGGGGFGSVYKGFLRGNMVAIKKIHSQSTQGLSEFENEVTILSTTQHPNLVRLIGVCFEEYCLVYEFLPNGSLEDRLASANCTNFLAWQVRTRIICEMCSALMFLHSKQPHPVIHGDLKPSNILLDVNLASKLSDFGISRLVVSGRNNAASHYTTTPKGTLAYMDPELVYTDELTPKSDVYALGVVILRLLTKKPALRVVKEVEGALRDDRLQFLIDDSAGGWPLEQAKILAVLGLRCANLSSRRRPDLASVVWPIVEPLMQAVLSSSWKYDRSPTNNIQLYTLHPRFQAEDSDDQTSSQRPKKKPKVGAVSLSVTMIFPVQRNIKSGRKRHPPRQDI